MGATVDSSITVGDDWDELDFVCRVAEGSNKYNVSSVKTKNDFTAGSPTQSTTFAGFFWNTSYYYSARIGLTGSGTNQKLQLRYSAYTGWNPQGIYIYKR